LALTAYFDDSGTHPESPAAIVAGWIAPHQQWKKFNKEWEKLKDKEGFQVFHMADLMFSAREFEGWDEEKIEKVVAKAREIIHQRVVTGFAVVVGRDDYDELATEELKRKFGKHHYTFAVRTALGLIERWREQVKINEPIEYIFDRMTKGTGAKGEIDRVFEDAEKLDNSLQRFGIYKSCHSFAGKGEVTPLQAADIVAWLVFQRMMADVKNRNPRDITIDSFNYFSNRKLLATHYTREQLKDYLAHEHEEVIKHAVPKININPKSVPTVVFGGKKI
jgi:hypothetical protein